MSNFGSQARLTIDGVPVGRLLPPADEPAAVPPPAGSCITIVITDGPLDSAACVRLARRAGLGLARTGSTGDHGSGEIFLALATGLRTPRGVAPTGPEPVTGRDLDPLFAAVARSTAEGGLNDLPAAPARAG